MKRVGSIILLVLTLILVIQNVESVETRILFYKLELPRALLLFATFAIGFIAGSLWTTSRVSH